MECTTTEHIQNYLESLQHKRNFAQERIDAIGLYQRALATYKENTPSCPEIHH